MKNILRLQKFSVSLQNSLEVSFLEVFRTLQKSTEFQSLQKCPQEFSKFQKSPELKTSQEVSGTQYFSRGLQNARSLQSPEVSESLLESSLEVSRVLKSNKVSLGASRTL
ncbi:hypothetical protein XELAEV_18034763mg [Xenopus laevis]|uniref:Uncharacterized protein n=1 Tax=Xenopus laevis TaxID=8355 RepID=A0A974CEI1_XENLA|nr:hypothetical protein XELAEV_18034763mg [Xenopus laevis]